MPRIYEDNVHQVHEPPSHVGVRDVLRGQFPRTKQLGMQVGRIEGVTINGIFEGFCCDRFDDEPRSCFVLTDASVDEMHACAELDGIPYIVVTGYHGSNEMPCTSTAMDRIMDTAMNRVYPAPALRTLL